MSHILILRSNCVGDLREKSYCRHGQWALILPGEYDRNGFGIRQNKYSAVLHEFYMEF